MLLVRRSRLGLLLRALSDSPAALEAHVARCLKDDPDGEVMVLGDFNATRDEESFGKRGLKASTDADAVISPENKDATVFDTRAPDSANPVSATHFTRPYPYDGADGQWKALDHIFVSRGLLDNKGLAWVPGPP